MIAVAASQSDNSLLTLACVFWKTKSIISIFLSNYNYILIIINQFCSHVLMCVIDWQLLPWWWASLTLIGQFSVT